MKFEFHEKKKTIHNCFYKSILSEYSQVTIKFKQQLVNMLSKYLDCKSL